MYHFHCHLYFLKGSAVWISPLAVLWGITKVNCSFTGTGEVTAATPIPSPPFLLPSIPPHLFESFGLLLPSRFITLLHKCILPLMVSPGTRMWPPRLTVQGQSRYSAERPLWKTNNTRSVLHRRRKHVPTYTYLGVKQPGLMRRGLTFGEAWL